MKKPTNWAGAIGAFFALGSVFSFVGVLMNPTPMLLVNATNIVSNILWIAFGVFLFGLFLRNKSQDEAKASDVSSAQSFDDQGRLATQRRWILSLVLIVISIGSVQIWILNDYSAGLTSKNLFVIVDLIASFLMMGLAIDMLMRKRDRLSMLFNIVVVYSLIEICILATRHEWAAIFASALFAAYVMYAIKAPLSRTNHRIAHYVLLPVFIVGTMATASLDNLALQDLVKERNLLGQQYSNDLVAVDAAYQVFIQKDAPDLFQIQEVKDAQAKADARLDEIGRNIATIKQEYQKQINTTPQQVALAQVGFLERTISLNREQHAKLTELMDYETGINRANPTSAQKAHISQLKSEFQGYVNKVTELNHEMELANLGQLQF